MKERVLRLGYFLVPVSLWLFLFRDILWGKAGLPSQETLHIYAVVKFYFEGLAAGTFPLWNPYVCWGMPIVIYLSYVGIFNPVWLLVPLLTLFSLDVYQAFLITITVWFFTGQLGFYLLARRLLRDEFAAYAAWLIFLFSSVSLPTFVQYHPVLIFVPAVWFLYFLLAFGQSWAKKDFLGLVFAGMMVFTAYLPLYFLTVFLILLVMGGALYPRTCMAFLGGMAVFLRKNAVLALVCGLALVAAGWTGLRAYQQTEQKEAVAPCRQNGQTVFEQGAAFAGYESTTDGGLSARTSLEELFVRLGDLEYNNEGLLYLSLPAWLVLLLAAGLPLTRRTAFYSGAGAVLFLLMVNDAAPVHRFLFDHLRYFKLLRNFHFLNPFFLALAVLLIGEQIRNLLAGNTAARTRLRRAVRFGLVLLAHGGVLFLLWRTREEIIVSTYLALGASLSSWGLRVLCRGEWRAGRWLFVLALLIQPVEVFWHYNAKAVRYGRDTLAVSRHPWRQAAFAFTRPEKVGGPQTKGNEQIYTLDYWLSLSDSPGYFMELQSGFPAYWSYYLATNLPEAKKAPLLRNKFVLYDRVKVDREGLDAGYPGLAAALLQPENWALVSGAAETGEAMGTLSALVSPTPGRAVPGRPRVITADTAGFRVIRFTANQVTVETDYPVEKFLVYTDSYSQNWQAFLNGRKTELFRANVGFKGVRLPPGKNEVVFRYRSVSTERLYGAVALLFLLAGVGVATVFVLDARGPAGPNRTGG